MLRHMSNAQAVRLSRAKSADSLVVGLAQRRQPEWLPPSR
jgi:hypothetical protein